VISGVRIEGLREFRAALAAAESANPRELTRVLKDVGALLAQAAGGFAPVGRADRRSTRQPGPGGLSSGYGTRVRGTHGDLVNKVPYAGGAEWGLHGRFKGFRRYPGPAPGGRGRFAWRAVYEQRQVIVRAIYDGLRSIITAHGWFHSKGR
jgi:hypothetical protein